MKNDIFYYDRYSQSLQKENIYGEAFIRFLYESKAGHGLLWILTQKFFSKLYGFYQNSFLSHSKIKPFIQKFNINMQEFEETPFKNFNQFFIRSFKIGQRPFMPAGQVLSAFAEGRYLAFANEAQQDFFKVKGELLSFVDLLKPEYQSFFKRGPVLISRLCPVDYHAFHFPTDGRVLAHYTFKGKLDSVSPIALKNNPELFFTNEKQITILETPQFGKLAYIEVGALCVGKIIQTFRQENFKKGDKKGHFLFGASTVILLGEPDKMILDTDIIQNSKNNRETFIKLGDSLAKSVL
ncbi:MAG: phosphatidylserine decarboxylase [Bacteriovoracaceae bacterium]|nr:phosphatidylserine decarboxylase [Bacteriovoracaceae bacterium]